MRAAATRARRRAATTGSSASTAHPRQHAGERRHLQHERDQRIAAARCVRGAQQDRTRAAIERRQHASRGRGAATPRALAPAHMTGPNTSSVAMRDRARAGHARAVPNAARDPCACTRSGAASAMSRHARASARPCARPARSIGASARSSVERDRITERAAAACACASVRATCVGADAMPNAASSLLRLVGQQERVARGLAHCSAARRSGGDGSGREDGTSSSHSWLRRYAARKANASTAFSGV